MRNALLTILIASLPSSLVFANDPAPMPVMKVAKPAEKANSPDYANAYRAIGRPSITILVNNRLGRQNFIWAPSENRTQIEVNANKQATGSSVTASAELTESQVQIEREKVYSDDTTNARLANLGSAFFETLTGWNVRIYDSETIQQIHQQNPDEQALINALKGKVQLLGEVYFHKLDTSTVNAQLRILDVSDGRLLAQSMTHLTGTKTTEKDEGKYEFIATSSGYKKVPVECNKDERECSRVTDAMYRRGVTFAKEFMHQLTNGYK